MRYILLCFSSVLHMVVYCQTNSSITDTLSINSEAQFYKQIDLAKRGILSHDQLNQLLYLSENKKNDSLSEIIGKQIIAQYKSDLDYTDINYSKNIQPLLSILPDILQIKSKLFNSFLKYSHQIDSIIQYPNYSFSLVSTILQKKDSAVSMARKSNKEPNWEELKNYVSTNFDNKFSEYLISEIQVIFYTKENKHKELSKSFIKLVSEEEPDTSMLGQAILNDKIYDIVFEYSENKSDLLKAAGWIKNIINDRPSQADGLIEDTYANLLYKAGKKDEALKWEAQALNLLPQNKEISETYKKMEKGDPTWK
jgi:hypothetical protein